MKVKYEVIMDFEDKNTHDYHRKGTPYFTEDKQRGEYLEKKGYVKKVKTDEKNSDESEGNSNIDVSILKETVSLIKKTVTNQLTQDQLNELLEAEEQGENRKGVTEHIESLIEGE